MLGGGGGGEGSCELSPSSHHPTIEWKSPPNTLIDKRMIHCEIKMRFNKKDKVHLASKSNVLRNVAKRKLLNFFKFEHTSSAVASAPTVL